MTNIYLRDKYLRELLCALRMSSRFLSTVDLPGYRTLFLYWLYLFWAFWRRCTGVGDTFEVDHGTLCKTWRSINDEVITYMYSKWGTRTTFLSLPAHTMSLFAHKYVPHWTQPSVAWWGACQFRDYKPSKSTAESKWTRMCQNETSIKHASPETAE